MQNIYVNQMQISRSEISVRYLIILVGGTANIGDIPESVVVIPVSRTSDTSECSAQHSATGATAAMPRIIAATAANPRSKLDCKSTIPRSPR